MCAICAKGAAHVSHKCSAFERGSASFFRHTVSLPESRGQHVAGQRQIWDLVLYDSGVLSPKTQYSLENAQAYFQEHLAAADYYTEDLSMPGEWIGNGALQLNLKAEVMRDDFLALCANQHPRIGGLLTQKLQNRRTEKNDSGVERSVANRRVFYDFTISAPKSVSIAALIRNDPRILTAHRNAVATAMQEMEPFAETRVRVGGCTEDRSTGSIVGALFTHTTSRVLDPHLHTHCIVFNATFDPVEGRWKALQNKQLLGAQKFVENVYYHSLAQSLQSMGYTIVNHRRGDFDLREVPQEWCTRFSKRHAQIETMTRALLEKHPEKAGGNVYRIRENIAQRERQTKVSGLTQEQLRRLWTSQLSPEENVLMEQIPRADSLEKATPQSATEALALAERHLFERRSVVAEYELWRYALEFARGSAFTAVDLRRESSGRNYLRSPLWSGKISLKSVLERELKILETVREGIGKYPPIAQFSALSDDLTHLDAEQRTAVATIFNSRDLVTLFRGGAGTGKSYTLREVVRGIIWEGRAVHVIAPQRQQACDLEASGLQGAATVSEFLARQAMTLGAVVVLDEAGQVGATQMEALLRVITERGGRLVCSGDTRQHGAVEGSDALRTIEKYAGVQAAEIRTIRRQDPGSAQSLEQAQAIREYRNAVADAAEGLAPCSFDRLDKLGAVVESGPEGKLELLAAHYLKLVEKEESILVVGQTWTEVRQLNQTIREALKKTGRVRGPDFFVEALEAVDVTDVQKRDARFYNTESCVVFGRPVAGFRRNQQANVLCVRRGCLVVSGEGKVREIPFSSLQHIRVCQRRMLAITPGDRLHLKANSRTLDGKRICNGELVTVSGVGTDGSVQLRDGRSLPVDYRQFGYGWAVTSYASQGKTVDHVFFSDSGVKAATNQEQWYVTISRGRKSVRVFTADKEALRQSIERSGHQELAVDIFGLRRSRRNRWTQRWKAGKRLILQFARKLSLAAWRERSQTDSSRSIHD